MSGGWINVLRSALRRDAEPSKKTLALAVVELSDRLDLTERELRGHTHNSFSGEYFVGFPLRKELER